MKQELVKLCVDTVYNRVQNYSKYEADEVIRKAFFEILGTDKPTYKDVRKHKVEVFEILEEVLDQTIISGMGENNFFLQFAEVRNLALGDSQEFYVPDNSVLVAAEHAGNHWNIRRQKLDVGTSFTVKTKAYAVAVYADFLQFLAGRIDFAGLVAKVAKAMQEKLNEEVYASFMGSMNYLPAQFKATGTYNEDTLMDIIAHVEATTGFPVLVAGTRKALSKVLAGVNATFISENMKDQVNRQGMVQYINGVPLLQIPNYHKPNTFDFAISDSRLMILPTADVKPIKIVYEGDSLVKEVSDGTDNMDMSLEYKFITRFGVNVVFNTLYGMYEIA